MEKDRKRREQERTQQGKGLSAVRGKEKASESNGESKTMWREEREESTEGKKRERDRPGE